DGSACRRTRKNQLVAPTGFEPLGNSILTHSSQTLSGFRNRTNRLGRRTHDRRCRIVRNIDFVNLGHAVTQCRERGRIWWLKVFLQKCDVLLKCSWGGEFIQLLGELL